MNSKLAGWLQVGANIDILPQELREYIDQTLEEFPPDVFTRYYDEIQQRTRENQSTADKTP